MQKTYLKLSLLAVLVAGATMAISCSKEEEVSNFGTKIGGLEQTLPGDEDGDGDDDDVSLETVYWWHYKMVKDEEGRLILIKECLPYPPTADPKICMIRVENEEGNDATEGDVAADLDGEDGFVLRLKLTISKTNAELYKAFKILADEGVIEFEEDIEIEDPENLLSLKESYIPAGTYPIKFIDDKFVITINE